MDYNFDGQVNTNAIFAEAQGRPRRSCARSWKNDFAPLVLEYNAPHTHTHSAELGLSSMRCDKLSVVLSNASKLYNIGNV